MKKNKLGVMQGRLLPKYKGRYQAHPVGYWQDEFPIAAGLKLDLIEFIFDYNEWEKNPLMSTSGLEKIQKTVAMTGVGVKTVCADYFMEAPLHSEDSRIVKQSQQVLKKLLLNCGQLKITDIVIPCVDQSSLLGKSSMDRFVTNLKPYIEDAKRAKINLALETDLPPLVFSDLLERFNSPVITVNYDTGNSASLGFDPKEEVETYGQRITDLHIKDRVKNGASVLLSTGDTQFKSFFDALSALNFQGPIIMQAYRDDEGIGVFKKQLAWLRALLSEIVQ